MKNKSHLVPMALGLSLGVFWGFVILLIGFLSIYTSHAKALALNFSVFFHLGSLSSVRDVLLAGLMAFIDAFVFGFLVAGLYNLFSSCCSKKSGCCVSTACQCECSCCNKCNLKESK